MCATSLACPSFLRLCRSTRGKEHLSTRSDFGISSRGSLTVSSDEKVLDFPRVEGTSEENARRVLIEATRLASLAPGEWRLWIDRSAERLRIPRAILEDVIAAIIKDSETAQARARGDVMFGCSDVRMFTTGWAAPRRRSVCRTADVLALKSLLGRLQLLVAYALFFHCTLLGPLSGCPIRHQACEGVCVCRFL